MLWLHSRRAPRRAISSVVLGLVFAVMASSSASASTGTYKQPVVLGLFDISGIVDWFCLLIYGSMISVLSWLLSQILDRSDPDFAMVGFQSQYTIMKTVGLYAIVPFAILAILVGTLRGQLQQVIHTMAIAVPLAIIGVPGISYLVRLLQMIDQQLTDTIVAHTEDSAANYLTNLSTLEQAIILSPAGAVIAVFLSLCMALLLVFVQIELLLRESMMLLTMLFMPLAMAVAVWKPTRGWLTSMLEVLITLIFLRFIIVGILMFGFGLMGSIIETPLEGVGETAGAAISTIAVGTLVVIAACCAAPVLLTFILGHNVVSRSNTKDVTNNTPLALANGRSAARDQAVKGVKTGAKALGKLVR